MLMVDHPPRDACRTREQLDLALAALALEQLVTVVFIGEGVYHCLPPDRRPDSDVSAGFGSLELYDVDRFLIEEDSLLERDLGREKLRFDLEPISRHALRDLIREQDLLL